jgi:hypothetical protein
MAVRKTFLVNSDEGIEINKLVERNVRIKDSIAELHSFSFARLFSTNNNERSEAISLDSQK